VPEPLEAYLGDDAHLPAVLVNVELGVTIVSSTCC